MTTAMLIIDLSREVIKKFFDINKLINKNIKKREK
jgi:hypothetical protein